MAKKDLFRKLSYNEQLEEILETKTFSVDCKNLLLNMIYKLENSYNDYATVKRMVDSKKNLIEDILNIVKDCNEIKLVNPTSEKMEKFKKKNIMFIVDQKKKKIETEPNEKAMLNAIYSLPIEKKVYLDEQHSAIRNSLPYILEKGKSINRAEIIRDFDAWSWNTTFSEIPSIECNLIYQNLQMLLGKQDLEQWMNLENNKNSLEILYNKLNEMLERKQTEQFLNLIAKLSIIIYCKNNSKEKKRLKEELEWNTKELERLNDTVKLVDEVSNEKAKAIENIEKIDRILNDRELFEEELKKANQKEIDVKILTADDLETRLIKQRKRMNKQIREADDLLYVKQYMKLKSQVIRENNLLNSINENAKKEEYVLELQKYFIEGIKSKIIKAEDKKEIINLLYIIRYYKFVPYFNNIYIKDVPELHTNIEEIEDILVEKLIKQKAVSKFSNKIEFDKELIKKIFDMRMINLENINVEFTESEKILFYDVETIEKEIEIHEENVKIIKYNKKIKMFI